MDWHLNKQVSSTHSPMTTVCCVKVKCIRPEYQNLEQWCKDPANVYIGRKAIVFINGERYPKKDSLWANPYKIHGGQSREEAIEQYRLYMVGRLLLEPELREKLVLLRGKRLGCWCDKEVACHGDVLITLIENQ